MALSEMIAHRTNKSISYFFHCYYRPQRSWAKVIFLQASVCPQGGKGCLPQCMLGYNPPGPGRHPLGPDPPRADTPQTRHPSPWTRQTPPGADTPSEQNPPWTIPPGKQTSAYGQRAASTHPTGMHSCFVLEINNCFITWMSLFSET